MRLHYVDWGNPDAPPLLLVHGGRDHCRNWDWVAERLRRETTPRRAALLFHYSLLYLALLFVAMVADARL